jgi:small subunit ribosomal protein S16
MLSIRLQRIGRKKYPVYRMVVQQSHLTPTSGKVVKLIGRYNPHTKELVIDKDEANKYLINGAQPTQRVARLMVSQDVKMPTWFKFDEPKASKIKNAEKLRKNQPKEEIQEAPVEETKPEETEAVVAEEESQPVEEEVKAEA